MTLIPISSYGEHQQHGIINTGEIKKKNMVK